MDISLSEILFYPFVESTRYAFMRSQDKFYCRILF